MRLPTEKNDFPKGVQLQPDQGSVHGGEMLSQLCYGESLGKRGYFDY